VADVVVHGPVSWNLVVDLDELPAPRPHMQFATAHREVLGGTSAGKAAHLRDRGVAVELHTVLGTDAAAAAIEAALRRAEIPVVATRVDGASERHLNLMDRAGGRVSIYLDVPATPRTEEPEALALLVEACTGARAAVLDLSQPSRDVIGRVTATGVPIWTDLHDYDGRSSFHEPFLRAASFVFMNGDRLDDARDFLRSCVEGGAQVAVCTLGADGAIAMAAGARDLIHVPATPVPAVVDTNGAGDGFMAGFLAAHLDGADVARAMSSGADQAARALGTVELSPLLEPPDRRSFGGQAAGRPTP
jgi:sugar/nucleoside kinase (ribokinase family)